MLFVPFFFFWHVGEPIVPNPIKDAMMQKTIEEASFLFFFQRKQILGFFWADLIYFLIIWVQTVFTEVYFSPDTSAQ